METVRTGDSGYRGTDGPMSSAPAAPEVANPLSQVFLDAAVAAGFPLTEDFNGADADGAGWHDLSISGGTRQSTATAYLHPVRDRTNLTVLTGCRSRKLHFAESYCVGVDFERHGRPMTVYADVEVVLSAGAVDSPRLLLLSGVGPGVGRNLHDHPLCGVVYEAAQSIPAGRTNLAETSLLWRSDDSLPGPDVTDEVALRSFLARGTSTYYHPVGSCAMGRGPDAVVDAQLRVHGLTGLRVADASVMPRVVPVNTNAAAIMIGEKAADLIGQPIA